MFMRNQHFFDVFRQVLVCSTLRECKFGIPETINPKEMFKDTYSQNKFIKYCQTFGLTFKKGILHIKLQDLENVRERFNEEKFQDLANAEADRAFLKKQHMPDTKPLRLTNLINMQVQAGKDLAPEVAVKERKPERARVIYRERLTEINDDINKFADSVDNDAMLFDYPDWQELRLMYCFFLRFTDDKGIVSQYKIVNLLKRQKFVLGYVNIPKNTIGVPHGMQRVIILKNRLKKVNHHKYVNPILPLAPVVFNTSLGSNGDKLIKGDNQSDSSQSHTPKGN